MQKMMPNTNKENEMMSNGFVRQKVSKQRLIGRPSDPNSVDESLLLASSSAKPSVVSSVVVSEGSDDAALK